MTLTVVAVCSYLYFPSFVATVIASGNLGVTVTLQQLDEGGHLQLLCLE